MIGYSYCDFSKNSDVSVYMSKEGIVCDSCNLNELNSHSLENQIKAIEHLRKHEDLGHKVIKYTYTQLLSEITDAISLVTAFSVKELKQILKNNISLLIT